MYIFITEKPSVAMDYAEYLNIPQSKKDGFTEGYSDVLEKNIVITWAIGHLVTMSYPEVYDENLKKWSLDTLPFLPEHYKYEVINSVKQQFYIVKKLYNRNDLEGIFYCGDSGREGIYIQALIRMLAGAKKGIAEKVVWINSQTRDEVIRGIKTAKPFNEYRNLINAGFARAIEDYALGINFSRLLALKYDSEFNKAAAGKSILSVGRVMTCVLGLIVDRELSIENFVKTDWYKIVGSTKNFNADWYLDKDNSHYLNKDFIYEDKGFLNKEQTEKLVSFLNKDKQLEVVSIDKKEEKKTAPLLFNLAELQNECVKRFKISPDKTLEIIQELYEAKLITYPRTDARVLSSAVAKEIVKNIKGVSKVYPAAVDTIIMNQLYLGLEKTKYVNDKKITDHYAIIPTGEGDYSKLADLKNDIYKLIVRRFLAIFYPAAVFIKSDVRLKHSTNERFIYKEKILSFAGYLGLEEDVLAEREASKIENLKVGDKLQTDFSYETKETQPPKRYNSGSIILAMENAGKLIDDEELRAEINSSGIGTSATRAAIIAKLKDRKYIDINKKTQVVTPTNIGNAAYLIVKNSLPELLNPELTAKWEQSLTRIEKGEIEYSAYLNVMNRYITENVNRVKGMEVVEMGIKADEKLGECPVCKKGIIRKNNKGGYGCSRYKDGCEFYIGTVYGKELSVKAAADLIKGKVIGPVKGLKNREGKEFEAKLKLDENGKVVLSYDKKITDLICPKCSKALEETKYSYRCECGFNIWHTTHQKKIPKTDMVKILKGEWSSLIKGFVSRNGKTFDASVKWNDKENKYEFEFPKKSI